MVLELLKKSVIEILFCTVAVSSVLLYLGEILTINKTGAPDRNNLACAVRMLLLENAMRTHWDKMVLTNQTMVSQQREITWLSGTLSRYIDLRTTFPAVNGSVGTNYIRYGHQSCPNTATVIYDGFMGKARFTHTGGGSNYLCMPRDPDFLNGSVANYQSRNYLYGVQYEGNSPLTDIAITHYEAPCAVCEVEARMQSFMLPGKNVCPPGWTQEYQGLLMAEKSFSRKSDFVCVDSAMETLTNTSANVHCGALFVVEASCGALPCPPYVHGYEVTCVVCTK